MPKIFAAIFSIMLTASVLLALPFGSHPPPSPDFLLTPGGPNSDCAADSPADEDADTLVWDYFTPACNWRLTKAL